MSMLFKGRNYNVMSKHPYYSYLGKYHPFHIASQQTDKNFILGRTGNYRTLVKYYAGNHMTIEEHHSLNYKTPWWIVSASYTAAWYLTAYITIIALFYLGDPGRVFNTNSYDLTVKSSPDNETPTRYESIYQTDRPIKW